MTARSLSPVGLSPPATSKSAASSGTVPLVQNEPHKGLTNTLKAEVNEDGWATLHSDASRAFDKPKSGRIAVKVINHLGDEVMKVFRV